MQRASRACNAADVAIALSGTRQDRTRQCHFMMKTPFPNNRLSSPPKPRRPISPDGPRRRIAKSGFCSVLSGVLSVGRQAVSARSRPNCGRLGQLGPVVDVSGFGGQAESANATSAEDWGGRHGCCLTAYLAYAGNDF
jgi:hypothetical protein